MWIVFFWLAVAAFAWQSLRLHFVRESRDYYKHMAEGSYAKLQEWDRAAKISEAVNVAVQREALAWKEAEKAWRANKSLTVGMKRMARRMKKLTRLEASFKEMDTRLGLAVQVVDEMNETIELCYGLDKATSPQAHDYASKLQQWVAKFDVALLQALPKKERVVAQSVPAPHPETSNFTVLPIGGAT